MMLICLFCYILPWKQNTNRWRDESPKKKEKKHPSKCTLFNVYLTQWYCVSVIKDKVSNKSPSDLIPLTTCPNILAEQHNSRFVHNTKITVFCPNQGLFVFLKIGYSKTHILGHHVSKTWWFERTVLLRSKFHKLQWFTWEKTTITIPFN